MRRGPNSPPSRGWRDDMRRGPISPPSDEVSFADVRKRLRSAPLTGCTPSAARGCSPRPARGAPAPRLWARGAPAPPRLRAPLRFAPREDAGATAERLSGATPPPFLSAVALLASRFVAPFGRSYALGLRRAFAMLSLDVVVSLSARPRAQQGARFGCQAAERPRDTHDRHREKEKVSLATR